MDAYSEELDAYLRRLSQDEHCVSHRMEHYTEHLLHLLNPRDEELLYDCYGLFGHHRKPVDLLALENKTTPDIIRKVIETLLRRLAMSPEWQMMRTIINKANHNT